MEEYHKIVTVWERDDRTKFRTLIEGQWATPEFAYLKDNDWVWTEKLDGTNIRVLWDGEKVVFGGRTDHSQLYAPLVEWMHGKFYAGAMDRALEAPAVLYGEGFGAGIQGGDKFRSDTVVVLFDVRCGDLWLRRESVQDIAKKLELEVVPVVGQGSLLDAINMARRGFPSFMGSGQAEGLVMRPTVELMDRRGNRVITKIKRKDFPEG